MIDVHRVSHIGVCVRDLDRSLTFYRDVLGFAVTGQLEVDGPACDRLLALEAVKLKAVYIERDGFCLELLFYSSPTSPMEPVDRTMNDLGFTHLSVQVPDVGETLQRLRRRGIPIDDDRTVEFDGRVAAAFVRDPDGLPIELTGPR